MAQRLGVKRRAQQSGESKPTSVEIPQVAIATVNEHTRGLLHVVIAILLLVGLWFIWSDLVPALTVLKRITLWQYTVTLGGEPLCARARKGCCVHIVWTPLNSTRPRQH